MTKLTGIPEIDDQVLAGAIHGYFGGYEGAKMGGKWWINKDDEVEFKTTAYFDVHSEGGEDD